MKKVCLFFVIGELDSESLFAVFETRGLSPLLPLPCLKKRLSRKGEIMTVLSFQNFFAVSNRRRVKKKNFLDIFFCGRKNLKFFLSFSFKNRQKNLFFCHFLSKTVKKNYFLVIFAQRHRKKFSIKNSALLIQNLFLDAEISQRLPLRILKTGGRKRFVKMPIPVPIAMQSTDGIIN